MANNSKKTYNKDQRRGNQNPSSVRYNKTSKVNKRSSNQNMRKSGEAESYTRDDSNNDPAWYSTDANLLRDSSSIPFSEAMGTPVSLHPPYSIDITNTDSAANADGYVTVPGIMTFSISPSIGPSSNSASPINVAATSLYTFVRKANSGSANYDSTDMMLYTLAMSNIYSYIVYLQRVYGIATLYSHRNRYMPTALLESMNIDANDIQANMAQFRYGINILINKAASFIVPKTVPLFYRYSFLYRDVYTEGTSVKDQMYLYTPASFWRYEWDANDNYKGMLKAYHFPNSRLNYDNGSPIPVTGKLTYKNLLDFGEFLMFNLLGDEDVNIMCGDILKAFGETNIIKLSPLDTDYPLVPKYDIQVLEQMKNATVCYGFNSLDNTTTPPTSYYYPSSDAWDVKQYVPIAANAGNSYLVHEPMITIDITAQGSVSIDVESSQVEQFTSMQAYLENRFITTAASDSNPDIVMENTRLMVAGDKTRSNLINVKTYVQGGNLHATWKLGLICGSDVCVGCRAYYYDVEIGGTVSTTLQNVGLKYVEYMGTGYTATQLISITNELARITAFKYHPCISMLTIKQAPGFLGTSADTVVPDAVVYNENYFFDLDNYTTLDADELRNIHQAALMSLLHVPAISRI